MDPEADRAPRGVRHRGQPNSETSWSDDGHGSLRDASVYASRCYDERVRTTITLEADVYAAVERLRRQRKMGLSEAVNQLARAGMTPRPRAPRFRQRSARLGLRIDVGNVAEALEVLDGPAGSG